MINEQIEIRHNNQALTAASKERADQAFAHISNGWLPLKLSTKSKFKSLISDTPQDRTTLIELIKGDHALFSHLASRINQIGIDHANPLEALKKIPDDKLELLIEGLDKSNHQAEKATSLQRLRSKHALITSVTAESFAEGLSLPKEDAFTTAQLSELGHNLLAWNYPQLYSQACSRNKRLGEDLNQALEKIVGISPARIAARFASEWGLSSEVRGALEQLASPTPQARFKSRISGPALSDVCRIAEYYAQTQDLQHFPRAKALWENERKSLEPFLGRSTIDSIVDRVKAIVNQYLEYEESTNQDQETQLEDSTVSTQAQKLFAENKFALRLSKEMQTSLLQTYQLVQSLEVSPRAISDIAKRLSKEFKFKAGCLFLMNESNILAAALKIGDAPAIDDLNAFLKSFSRSISGSLYCRMPFKRVSDGIRGNEVIQVFGSLDHTVYDGVLYLESEQFDSNLQHILYFQALRRVLVQALGDK